MQRYQVRFVDEANPRLSAGERINDAFDQQGRLDVHGEKESVAVDFSLEVSRFTKAREGARVMMRFTGVTVPEGVAYIADIRDANAEDGLIELEVQD